MSYEAPRKLNRSNNSMQKNLNKSFKSDTVKNAKSENKVKNKSITRKKEKRKK